MPTQDLKETTTRTHDAAKLSDTPAVSWAESLPDERLTRYLFDAQILTKYRPEGTTLVISGLDVRLADSFDPAIEDLRVYGHIVRINGALRTHNAAQISIFCRYLIFEPGASIEVSGLGGGGKIEGQAKPGEQGENQGDQGKLGGEGAKGRPGHNGGTIHVLAERILGTPILIANGGSGGSGQDGGKGGPGRIGVDGVNQKSAEHQVPGSKFRVHVVITRHATAGGPGGRGGKGGRGGQRGHHGSAGTILIRSVHPVPDGKLEALPGQNFVADPEAEGGPGGDGMDGGKGGFMLYDPSEPGRQISKRCPDGPHGLTGEKGDPPPPAENGSEGTVDKRTVALAELWQTLWDQEPFLSGYQSDNTVLAMTLFAAERLYLNADSPEDTRALANVLSYLRRATEGATRPKLKAMHARCGGLLLNLERGLDYYGKLPNSVPSLSFEEYVDSYREDIKTARDLEADARAFWAEQEAKRNTITFFKKQMASVGDMIEKRLKQQKGTLDKKIRGLHDSIASFNAKLAQQEKTIRDASEDFHQGLLRKVQCDKLTAIFTVAQSIVQTGVNSVPAFSGLRALSELPFDDSQTFSERCKPLGTIAGSVMKVRGDVQSISQAFNALNKAEARKSADSVKLVVEKDKFDETMKQFTDIPEAKPYIDAMHEYMNIANQRNTAILNHDAALIELANLTDKIDLAEKQTADLESHISENQNALRPAFIQYIEQALQLAKALVIDTLYSISRSLEYYTLSPQPVRVVDYKVSTLEGYYANLISEFTRAKEEAGARAHFARDYFITDHFQIDRLKHGKPIWFVLPVSTNCRPLRPFANIERPLVQKVRCFLEGATPADAEVTITIQHCGISYLYDEQNRASWVFAHSPRPTSFKYRIGDRTYEDDQGDLTEGEQFMMLSPFAVWGVQIRPEDDNNQDVDLSGLKKVTLTFEGKGVVRQIEETDTENTVLSVVA